MVISRAAVAFLLQSNRPERWESSRPSLHSIPYWEWKQYRSMFTSSPTGIIAYWAVCWRVQRWSLRLLDFITISMSSFSCKMLGGLKLSLKPVSENSFTHGNNMEGEYSRPDVLRSSKTGRMWLAYSSWHGNNNIASTITGMRDQGSRAPRATSLASVAMSDSKSSILHDLDTFNAEHLPYLNVYRSVITGISVILQMPPITHNIVV